MTAKGMPASIHLLFAAGLIGLILYYTRATSVGESWLKRLGRFLGLAAASMPLIGFIELAVFRETDHDYGVACGRIMGLSLLWIGLSKLWSAFL